MGILDSLPNCGNTSTVSELSVVWTQVSEKQTSWGWGNVLFAVCRQGLVLWLCAFFFIKCFSASNEIVIEFSFMCMCWPIQTGFLNFRNIRSMSWKPLLPNIIPAYLLMQLHKRGKQKYKIWEEESKPTATDRWCACVSRKPKKIN